MKMNYCVTYTVLNMTTTMTTQTHSSRPNLRQTDFLPARFSGARLARDDSTAHFLTFADYLDAHDIDTTDANQLPTIVQTFKRTLQGQARLWIDKLTFRTYDDLKDSFIQTERAPKLFSNDLD